MSDRHYETKDKFSIETFFNLRDYKNIDGPNVDKQHYMARYKKDNPGTLQLIYMFY